MKMSKKMKRRNRTIPNRVPFSLLVSKIMRLNAESARFLRSYLLTLFILNQSFECGMRKRRGIAKEC